MRFVTLRKIAQPPAMGKGRNIFDTSVTEIVRLAMDRNGFRSAVKDVACRMARDKQLK